MQALLHLQKPASPAWLRRADMTLSYQESPIRIDSPGASALGLVCIPKPTAHSTSLGVIFIPGGFQYRAGSHRQAVRLARHLAQAGITSLRFDLAGLGDATGAVLSFENLTPQLTAAINALVEHAPHVKEIVLWGLCDGASAAMLHWKCTRDARIVGLALLNPWVRSESTLARTHVRHYYRQRLRDKLFWQKVLRGGIGIKAIIDLLKNLRAAKQSRTANPASFQEKMATTWRTFNGAILLMISENDITGQEFMEATRKDAIWAGCLQSAHLTHVTLTAADHTCSSSDADLQLCLQTQTWLNQLNQRRRRRPA